MRKLALADRPVAVVANSVFTRGLVERSQVFADAQKHTIYPGIDFTRFHSTEKPVAKMALGISPECFLLGFGAASLTDRNKGIERFLDVAQRVHRIYPETEVLIFGKGDLPRETGGLTIHQLGEIASASELSLAMSASDAFLVTSKIETLGQVAVEAQGCGTPVWAYAVGGLPETIQPGISGGLIPFANSDEMAGDIIRCREAGLLPEMGRAAYKWASQRFSSEAAGKQYSELYRDLVNGHSHVATC